MYARYSDMNGLVQLSNANLRAGNNRQRIAISYSLRTGDVIPGFPTTLQEADIIRGNTISNHLEELGLDIEGSVEGKRARLRAFIGLALAGGPLVI